MDSLRVKIANVKGDETFAYAVISAALGVALADEDLSIDEQQKIRRYIEATNHLGLSEERARAIFVEVADRYNVDYTLGLEDCRHYLHEAKDKEYKREIAILAVAIAALELDPEEFSLDSE